MGGHRSTCADSLDTAPSGLFVAPPGRRTLPRPHPCIPHAVALLAPVAPHTCGMGLAFMKYSSHCMSVGFSSLK